MLAGVTAGAMGIALAALPHTENDPCFEFKYEEVPTGPPVEPSVFPLGYDCAPGVFLGPSVAATIAWMAFAGVLVALALRRPTPVMRGALAGAATLSLMGAIYMRWGPFVAIFINTLILSVPIAFGLARFAGVVIAPVALSVWAFPYLLGYGNLANFAGIAAGAGTAWVLDRLWRRFGHIWRPRPQ